jgi:glycine/D-amino acid oxidase-like deaminating enzyme/nitrite reductase/ring-hydroxylating ferredoxin subunit
MKTTDSISRDGKLESPWQKTSYPNTQSNGPQHPDDIYDCLIVGGGITGLTAALLLQKAGRKTIIAEAANIGFGTTGGTSAHINTFADTNYKEAESAFGEDGAQLFADAVLEGFGLISSNIDKYQISCDYATKTGFVYAETEEEISMLDNMYKGTVKVGVPVQYVEEVPTPVKYIKALQFDGQAQFHPLKYLKGLEAAYIAAGGIVQENMMIKNLSNEDDIHIAETETTVIRACNVIYATHMPPGITVLNFEAAPYRSYVLAVKLKSSKYPDALIYDCQDPYHYIRTHVIDGEELLIVGGADHKTGHSDPAKAFADLEKYVRNYYNVSSVKYRWSSQYYIPADGLPYIGQMPLTADGVYCATGYNGNGMMLGSVAGKILSDLVRKRPNRYAELFSPSRIKPIDSFKEFVRENADVVYHFVADRINIHEIDYIKRLQPGTGKVVEVDGKKIAAYRDEQGNVHALSPVCTHAGCIVNWNAEEKTWDCPCHGARYTIEGRVLTGPATRGLSSISIEK